MKIIDNKITQYSFISHSQLKTGFNSNVWSIDGCHSSPTTIQIVQSWLLCPGRCNMSLLFIYAPGVCKYGLWYWTAHFPTKPFCDGIQIADTGIRKWFKCECTPASVMKSCASQNAKPVHWRNVVLESFYFDPIFQKNKAIKERFQDNTYKYNTIQYNERNRKRMKYFFNIIVSFFIYFIVTRTREL